MKTSTSVMSGHKKKQERRRGGESAADRGSQTLEFFKKRLKDDARRMTPEDIEELDQDVPRKLSDKGLNNLKDSIGWIEDMLDRVKILFKMVRDRSFKIDLRTKALVAAGLAYFVLPTDMIPDFIPGVGYIDDALVLSTLWKLVHEQIDRYVAFLEDEGERPEMPRGRKVEMPTEELLDIP